MRGRRRTIASALADALPSVPGARPAALAAAFAAACGPRLAREASVRGTTKEGRLLVVATTAEWAAQIEAAAPILCARVNERIGARSISGIDVRVSGS